MLLAAADSSILKDLESNLLTPIPLCFLLGIICKVIHGGIKIPKELYYTISIFLLMSIGFMGGHELCKNSKARHDHDLAARAGHALPGMLDADHGLHGAALCSAEFSIVDSAGIAAHYGSTSAVTFAVATAVRRTARIAGERLFADAGDDSGMPRHRHRVGAGGGLSAKAPRQSRRPGRHRRRWGSPTEGNLWEALYEVITGQSIMLMGGLLIIGCISTYFMSEKAFQPFHEFFFSKGMLFRGGLCIFLLEMGLVAGERLGDLKKVGRFLIAFGILLPIAHGFLGRCSATWRE